jgi:hypothetical protein
MILIENIQDFAIEIILKRIQLNQHTIRSPRLLATSSIYILFSKTLERLLPTKSTINLFIHS